MKALLAIILLASPVVVLAQADAPARAMTACGPKDAQFNIKIDKTTHSMAEPEAGKALVYVIQDQKTKYVNDVTIRVAIDGSWMGADRGDSYFFFAVTPGVHHLCGDWITSMDMDERIVALANFTAESGKTYYFRARNWGSMRSRDAMSWVLDLDAVNEDQGRLLAARSGLSVSTQKKDVAEQPTNSSPQWGQME
jgi:hypothetical protein